MYLFATHCVTSLTRFTIAALWQYWRCRRVCCCAAELNAAVMRSKCQKEQEFSQVIIFYMYICMYNCSFLAALSLRGFPLIKFII